MFFRRRNSEPAAAAGWAGRAPALGFGELPAADAALLDSIDPHSTPLLSGVYGAVPAPGISARIFEFRSDQLSGSLQVAAFACVLLAEAPFCPAAIRFSRKLPAQLEAITASSSRALPFSVAADPEFSSRVTVLARNPAAAGRVLTPAVRRTVTRMVDRQDAAFLLSASANQLFLQVPAETADGDLLEILLSDLLTLLTAFRQAGA